MYNKSDFFSKGYKTYSDLVGWEKCYIFLRLLIDTNRFGALAKDKKRIEVIKDGILTTYRMLLPKDDTEEEKIKILKNILSQLILSGIKPSSNKYVAYSELLIKLSDLIAVSKDFLVFAITIQEFLIPTNKAIEQVPTSEATEFAKVYGKALLDEKNEFALATLIRDWDLFTEALSINKERDIIVTLIYQIREKLKKELIELNENLTDVEYDIVVSAVCQEFERRTGQKRKQRAGNDLESVTQFIFNYFKIKTAGGPEHFTTGIEVDNWIKDTNGWYIGISLKRTLRERWKQTYTTDVSVLDRHKIKYVIHLINNDFDLSDSKITELGSYRHLFFMADNSTVFQNLKSHVAMGKYLFPMSDLIKKIKELTK
jgi:hypothetical protein